ncbi:MAG: VOC family protein [Phycisphaerales bacterium]
MQLGKFSVSLPVRDLAASRASYEALGLSQTGGQPEHNWIVLSNGSATIGLFQGMFEDTILTFNPGWSDKAEPLAQFEDVRSIQARLKAAGVKLLLEADPESTGPAHIVMQDPDGNQIMLDQHVDRPS